MLFCSFCWLFWQSFCLVWALLAFPIIPPVLLFATFSRHIIPNRLTGGLSHYSCSFFWVVGTVLCEVFRNNWRLTTDLVGVVATRPWGMASTWNWSWFTCGGGQRSFLCRRGFWRKTIFRFQGVRNRVVLKGKTWTLSLLLFSVWASALFPLFCGSSSWILYLSVTIEASLQPVILLFSFFWLPFSKEYFDSFSAISAVFLWASLLQFKAPFPQETFLY